MELCRIHFHATKLKNKVAGAGKGTDSQGDKSGTDSDSEVISISRDATLCVMECWCRMLFHATNPKIKVLGSGKDTDDDNWC